MWKIELLTHYSRYIDLPKVLCLRITEYIHTCMCVYGMKKPLCKGKVKMVCILIIPFIGTHSCCDHSVSSIVLAWHCTALLSSCPSYVCMQLTDSLNHISLLVSLPISFQSSSCSTIKASLVTQMGSTGSHGKLESYLTCRFSALVGPRVPRFLGPLIKCHL